MVNKTRSTTEYNNNLFYRSRSTSRNFVSSLHCLLKTCKHTYAFVYSVDGFVCIHLIYYFVRFVYFGGDRILIFLQAQKNQNDCNFIKSVISFFRIKAVVCFDLLMNISCRNNETLLTVGIHQDIFSKKMSIFPATLSG